jgi:lysophospholipase L1-like esterase
MNRVFAAGFLVLVLAAAATQASAQTPKQPRSKPDSTRIKAQRAAEDERLRTDWASLQKFAAANAQLSSPVAGEDRVVFMGNSIFEMWARHFSSMFPGKPYINRGIGGQTTPQMLVRFRQDVIALKPKVVVILAGTNDIAGNTGPSTLEMIENNLASMSELAKASGIRVVLASVLPAYSYAWRPSVRQPAQTIVALNQWIRDYARRNGHVYLDYHGAMADDRLGMRGDLSGDGVHPNEAGYRIMAPLTVAAIREALRDYVGDGR